jgi:hypothetical protein
MIIKYKPPKRATLGALEYDTPEAASSGGPLILP